MLNWLSWEEKKRKGGEGRIEDGRLRQAKNAIILVVGAGRPLCLDGKGSGDTQDEPRDHWHILTDRLVACARHGGSGAHRPPPHPPPLGFRGTRACPKGASPALCLMHPHSTPLSGHPAAHLLGQVCPSPGLTPGLLFLHPHGPSLSSRVGMQLQFSLRRAPLLAPQPGGGHLLIPETDLGVVAPRGWGGGGGGGFIQQLRLPGLDVRQRTWLASCFLSYTKMYIFSYFLGSG